MRAKDRVHRAPVSGRKDRPRARHVSFADGLALLFGARFSAARPLAELPPAAPAAAGRAAGAPLMLDARLAGDEAHALHRDLSQQIDVAHLHPRRPLSRRRSTSPRSPSGSPTRPASAGRGLISAFRYGIISPGSSRIVIDVAGPVADRQVLRDRAANDQPARLVVDVGADHPPGVHRRHRAYRENQAMERRHATLLSRRPRRPAAALVVVLDPGHGGIDIGTGRRAAARWRRTSRSPSPRCWATSSRRPGSTTCSSPEPTTASSRSAIVSLARAHHADLFVSIHANSLRRRRRAQGTTVYTVSEQASDEMRRELPRPRTSPTSSPGSTCPTRRRTWSASSST